MELLPFYPMMTLLKVVDASGNVLNYRTQTTVQLPDGFDISAAASISVDGDILRVAYSVEENASKAAHIAARVEEFDLASNVSKVEVLVQQSGENKKVLVASHDAEIIEP